MANPGGGAGGRGRRWPPLLGYAYIAPNFLGFLVFTLLPVLAVGVMAFYKGSFTTRFDPAAGGLKVAAEYAGLDNFRQLGTELGEGGELRRKGGRGAVGSEWSHRRAEDNRSFRGSSRGPS